MGEQGDLAAAEEYMRQVNATRRTIQPRQAEDIAGVVAEYTTLSPDLTAAMALTTLPSDYADMGSIVRRDLVQQPSIGRFLRNKIPYVGPAAANMMGDVGSAASYATRQLTAGMYDLWDAGIPTALRTGVNAYQEYEKTGDLDPVTAFRRSYGSIASQQALAVAEGEMSPMDVVQGKGLGTGLMVGRPEDLEEMPGYGTTFTERLLEGDTPQEAKSYTDQWAKDKFGYDVVNGAWERAEATRINVTVDGVDYDYGVSLGRMALTPAYTAQLLDPESIAARLITGTIDSGSQIWMDPTDVISDSMTRAWARARKLQPEEITSVDELIMGSGGHKLGNDFANEGPSVDGFSFSSGDAVSSESTFTDQLNEAVVTARDNGEEVIHVYRTDEVRPLPDMERVHPELEGYQRIARDAELNRSNRIEYLADESEAFSDALDDGMDAWDARIYLTEEEADGLANVLKEEQDALDELKTAVDDLPKMDATPVASIPIDEVEEMIARQYFFLGGKAELDEAWKVVDDWKLSRVHGRWEARSPEEFLGDNDGKGLVEWLADESIPDYKKIERLRSAGIPMGTIDDWLKQIRIAEAAHEDAVIRAMQLGDDFKGEIPPLPDRAQVAAENVEAWINGQKLTQRVTAPASYRAANLIENSTVRLTGEARRPQPVRPWSDWGRRWAAHSTKSKIDPYDMDTTFETIVQMLRTIPNTTDETIDAIVDVAMRGRGNPTMPQRVQRLLIDELEAAWKRGDIDDELIVRTMEDVFEQQNRQVMYGVDSLVNPIAEKDAMFRWERTPGGVMFRVPANQAGMATELSSTAYHVPSIRQVRRATSKARQWRAKYLKHLQANPDAKLLMTDSEMQRLADIASSGWRTLQLLRPGWMMSVTPDEMARAVFDGHADLFANPITAFNVMFRDTGNQLPTRALDELVAAEGGLGAGMQKGMRDAERDTLSGQQSTNPGGAWIPIRVFDPNTGEITRVASEAYVREWVRHFQDPISQLLYRMDGDLDAAFEALTHPASPDRQIISDILAGGGKGAYPDPEIRLGRIDPDTKEGQQAIWHLLEATEARRHLMTGGDWLRRDPLKGGAWVDSAGNRVELYDGINIDTKKPWTRKDMIAEMETKAADQGVTLPRGYKRMPKADLQAALLDMEGHTRGLLNVSEGENYHIFKKGDPDLRNVLGGGKLARERLPAIDSRAKVLAEWGSSSGIDEGNRMFIIVGDEVDLPPMQEAELPVRNADLPRTEETVVEFEGKPMSRYEYEAEVEFLEEDIARLEASEGRVPAYASKLDYDLTNDDMTGLRPLNMVDADEQLVRQQERLARLEGVTEGGRAISGPGAEPIPVAESGHDLSGISESSWDAIGDDEFVDVYHATETDIAREFLDNGISGKAKPRLEGADVDYYKGRTGEGLYVGADEGAVEGYSYSLGDSDDLTVIRIRVRKKDVLVPREAAIGETALESLNDPNVGGIVHGDIPAENVEFVSRSGDMPSPRTVVDGGAAAIPESAVETFPAGSEVAKSASHAGYKAKKGSRVVLVDMEGLSDEAQLRLMEGSVDGKLLDDIEYDPKVMRSLSPEEYDEAAVAVANRSEDVLISAEMDAKQLDELAAFVREGAFGDDYQPVPYIKGQAKSVTERETTLSKFIDEAFTILGQRVSDKMARIPYVRIKTWEGFADAYLHASPSLRKEIRLAAGRANFSANEFEAIVSRQMRLAGYKELPLPAKVQLTMEEIEQMAVARAIERTKDLFFDLSKRSNFWDASKLIFPFGDAWWEVLSRWTKLFNPMKAEEFGRPFKNLSRLESASVGAQRSGYYDVDEQGNRVYTWFPTTVMNQALLEVFGEHAPGMDMTFGTSIDQSLFINPADPRSLLGPGGSIQLQSAAAIFRPLYEDKAIADVIDWAVYGSWNPTEATSKDVVNMILPSYLRRFWDLLQAGEYDERYASRQVDVLNGMVASDPQYANFMTDGEVQKKLIDDSRKFTIRMAFVEAVASIFGKVPRAQIEVLTVDTEGSEQMRKLSAVSADYAWLMNDAGMSQDEAVSTIRQWYGIDPLSISPKSYMVISRPLTKTGYDFMVRHEDEAALLPLTIAAFMPPTNGEQFYQREYQRQIDDEERQKLIATQSVQLTSYRGGSERMQVIKDERDLKLAQAKAIYGADSDIYRQYRDVRVAQWYNTARMNIESSYFYEQGAGGPAGLMKRPGIEQYKNEMVKIGTVGTPENEAAVKMDPALTLALQRVTSAWMANEDMAITLGRNPSWWYESSASSDPQAAIMRSTFQERLHRIVAETDEDTRQKLSWYVDTIMTPLITGFDRDDPLVIDVAPLPLPGG